MLLISAGMTFACIGTMLLWDVVLVLRTLRYMGDKGKFVCRARFPLSSLYLLGYFVAYRTQLYSFPLLES